MDIEDEKQKARLLLGVRSEGVHPEIDMVVNQAVDDGLKSGYHIYRYACHRLDIQPRI